MADSGNVPVGLRDVPRGFFICAPFVILRSFCFHLPACCGVKFLLAVFVRQI